VKHVVATEVTMPPATPKATGSDGQRESYHVLWEGADGRQGGVWECGPGTFPTQRDGFDEVCQVLAGAATVEGADGTVVEVRAGSLLVLPDGWSGTWTVTETLRKSFITIPT
jgi:uncharacterized cupin superfamily protein